MSKRALLAFGGFFLGAAILGLSVSIQNGEFNTNALARAGAPLLLMGGIIGAVLGLVVSIFLPKK